MLIFDNGLVVNYEGIRDTEGFFFTGKNFFVVCVLNLGFGKDDLCF